MASLNRVIALASILLLVGCVGTAPTGTDTDHSPTITEPSSSTATPAPTEPTTPNVISVGTERPPDRLEITSEYDDEFSLRLVNESSSEIAFTNTYPPNTSIILREKFQEGATYQAIIEVDDNVKWNETIYPYETYELTVLQNGSVRVDTVGEW